MPSQCTAAKDPVSLVHVTGPLLAHMMNVLPRLHFARCFDMGFHQNPQISSEKATRFKAKQDIWYFMSVSLYNPWHYLSLITKLAAHYLSKGSQQWWTRRLVAGGPLNGLYMLTGLKRILREMVFARATSAAKWFNKTAAGSPVSSGAGAIFCYLTKCSSTS